MDEVLEVAAGRRQSVEPGGLGADPEPALAVLMDGVDRGLGEALLWDLATKDPASSIRVLRRHEGPIWKVEFSGDSRWLVTFSGDGTARRWPMEMDQLVTYAKDAAGRDLTQDERMQFGLDEFRSAR